jgi:lysozyme family protein
LLPHGIDYSVFDYGVHSGVGRARKVHERYKMLEPAAQVRAINGERYSFLKHLRIAKHFPGWWPRVVHVRRRSLEMVAAALAVNDAAAAEEPATAQPVTQEPPPIIAADEPKVSAPAVVAGVGATAACWVTGSNTIFWLTCIALLIAMMIYVRRRGGSTYAPPHRSTARHAEISKPATATKRKQRRRRRD